MTQTQRDSFLNVTAKQPPADRVSRHPLRLGRTGTAARFGPRGILSLGFSKTSANVPSLQLGVSMAGLSYGPCGSITAHETGLSTFR